MKIEFDRENGGWHISFTLDNGSSIAYNLPLECREERIIFRLGDGTLAGLSVETSGHGVFLHPDDNWNACAIVDFDTRELGLQSASTCSCANCGTRVKHQAPVAKPLVDKFHAIVGKQNPAQTHAGMVHALLHYAIGYLPLAFSLYILSRYRVQNKVDKFMNDKSDLGADSLESWAKTMLEGILLGKNRNQHISNAMMVLVDVITADLPFSQVVVDYMETEERGKFNVGGLRQLFYECTITRGVTVATKLGEWLSGTLGIKIQDANYLAECITSEWVARTRTSFGKYMWEGESKQEYLFAWLLKWYLIQIAKEQGER